MKLSDSRTAKNIYNKGDSVRRIMSPSFSEIRKTSYLDVDKLVFFNKALIFKRKKNKQKIDFVKFFKEYNN